MKEYKHQLTEQTEGAQDKKRLLFDLETNGLLPNISKVHCAVLMPLGTGLTEQTQYPPPQLDLAVRQLRSARCLVGHNIIGFDLPALWKVKGPWDTVPLVLDTLVVSRFLWPERPWGHSLEGWGKHLGYPKIDFHDYEEYSPEMLEYCTRDVLLNYRVLLELEKEHGSPLEGFKIF